MNNLTNTILKRYGLKSVETKLSLATNVENAFAQLKEIQSKALDLEQDARGVYDEWMRATDEVASLSQDIKELAERIADISEIDYLATELEGALEDYKSAANELGVEEFPPNIQKAQDLFDEYLDSDISVWLFQDGAQIEEAASVADKFIP